MPLRLDAISGDVTRGARTDRFISLALIILPLGWISMISPVSDSPLWSKSGLYFFVIVLLT